MNRLKLWGPILGSLIFLIFLILLSLLGCASVATDNRKEGFNLMQKGFDSLPATPDLFLVIDFKEVTVYIVGDRKLFDWEKAKEPNSGVVGYANTNNQIWLFGKKVYLSSGQTLVVLNQAVLGHEFNHLLNFKNPEVANPDFLEDYGL